MQFGHLIEITVPQWIFVWIYISLKVIDINLIKGNFL